jgi:hypothetical protein
MPPVEPTAEDDGWTMTSGVPPVEAVVCSMPGGFELCTVGVGCTITSGIPPVEAGALSTTEEEGCTMVSGRPPVEAATELSRVGAAAEL